MDILMWAWVGWLAIALVCLVIELITLELTFLMLGLGSLVGLVASLGEGTRYPGERTLAAPHGWLTPPLRKAQNALLPRTRSEDHAHPYLRRLA